MKSSIVVSLVAVCAGALWGATSTPAGWTDDYEAALKRAKAEKKLVLADFSGSGWCGWCKKLDAEVFDTEVFRKAAAKKYVLLFIDSPDDPAKLSPQARKNNPKLIEKYRVNGFPTVLVLDEKGEVLGKTGYQKGGPEAYLENLEKIVTDAPMVLKHIQPIEDVLNGPDEKLMAEMTALQARLEKKYPPPPSIATDEVKKTWQMNMRREGMKAMAVVWEKYVPLYEKALEKAKAMTVPPEMAYRKGYLIGAQEKNLKQMKSMIEMAKKNADNGKSAK